MPGTRIVHADMRTRYSPSVCCYAVSGMHIVHAATCLRAAPYSRRAISLRAICLRACYAVPGTELLYTAPPASPATATSHSLFQPASSLSSSAVTNIASAVTPNPTFPESPLLRSRDGGLS
eukprot:1295417-Rhodomonas_salina.1